MDKRIIGLSLSTRSEWPLVDAFKVTKGDIGAYQLDIKIYDGAAEFDYSQATTARMVFVHETDGLMTTNDRGVITETGITYDIEATEISRVGKMAGSVQLLDVDGNRLTVSRFTFDVLADPLEAGGPLPTAPQVEQLVSYIAAAEQALNDIYGGVQLKGSYETYEDFIVAHPTGTAGDIYLAGIVLYVWINSISAWMNVGQIQGFGTPTNSETIEFEYNAASGILKAHLSQAVQQTLALATAAEPRITQNEEDVSLLEAQNNTGWNQLGLCTYVSATQVSVNGDIRDKVQKDDKLRWKQGGDFKHNYIRSVTYDSGTDKSIITITSGYQITQGDSSFVLSLAVTDVYYSHIENPIGFKPWFFWIPVITGFSSNPTMIVKFKIQNKECILVVTSTTNGTSNSGDFSITLPVAAANISGVRWRSYALVVDNGAIKDASCQITAGEAVLLFRSSGLTSFAASGNKSGNCQISFETQ